MKNTYTYTLKLTRRETCDLTLACLAIMQDAQREMRDPNTSDERKEILQGTIKKWSTLRDKIKAQRDALDAKHAE